MTLAASVAHAVGMTLIERFQMAASVKHAAEADLLKRVQRKSSAMTTTTTLRG